MRERVRIKFIKIAVPENKPKHLIAVMSEKILANRADAVVTLVTNIVVVA